MSGEQEKTLPQERKRLRMSSSTTSSDANQMPEDLTVISKDKIDLIVKEAITTAMETFHNKIMDLVNTRAVYRLV